MPKAIDRHGRDVEPGDTVELVFGGQLFHMLVDRVEPHRAAPDVKEIAHLHGRVELAIPAHSTRLHSRPSGVPDRPSGVPDRPSGGPRPPLRGPRPQAHTKADHHRRQEVTDHILEDNIDIQAQPEHALNPASLQISPYGCDVQPRPPLQDMFGSLDVIAGQFPPSDRMTPQGQFTGGIGSAGGTLPLGGQALPPADDKVGVSVPSNPAPNATQPL